MRREQDLGIANPAAQAQHASRLCIRYQMQDPRRHVSPQRPNRRTRKVPLRKTRVELLVIPKLALQNLLVTFGQTERSGECVRL